MENFTNILKMFIQLLPSKIISISLIGEQLIIAGENWSIGLTTSWWRVIQNSKLLFGYEEYEDKSIKELIGESVINLVPQSNHLKADLAIILSNGFIIETFSTCILEPWNITINGKVFYADPSNADWVK
jgi:hypothetical protein